jgi:hypothetical protein
MLTNSSERSGTFVEVTNFFADGDQRRSEITALTECDCTTDCGDCAGNEELVSSTKARKQVKVDTGGE